MVMDEKILIISKTEFNLCDSNGRVLGLLLRGIPNNKKIQFCVHGSSVSSELIEDSYRISDHDVLKNIFSRHIKAKKLNVDVSEKIGDINPSRKVKKSPLSMLIRDILWNCILYKTDFIAIVKEFKPNVIIWQYGDSGFIAKLVLKVLKESQAKLIVFSTEDYYFKTWNYLNKGKKSFIYKVYLKEMRYYTRQVFKNDPLCICNTPELASRFSKEFNCKTKVIMQPANKIELKKKNTEYTEKVIYAGNLGLNRHLSLIKIAETLIQIDSNIVFEIYGKVNDDILKDFKMVKNIRYMGFIDYSKLLNKIQDSKLIIHAESFEEFYRFDLQAAFSTKISDSLAMGIPLFIFAPENLAETVYLEENDCAFVCSKENDLDNILRDALFNNQIRENKVNKALEIVKKNHDSTINQKKMMNYISSVQNS